MSRVRWGLGMVGGAVLWFGCGDMPVAPVKETTLDPVTSQDGGMRPTTPDSGTPNNPNPPDAGKPTTPDAGRDAGVVDAGTPDAGLPAVNFPSSAGWTFYGPQDGLPKHLYGITADEGGNLWIAGGEDGLYLRRAGSTTFERFTMADGLHPYGYMPDGTDAPGPHYLKVISVTGGPAGTVFVGYAGKPPAPGQYDCESNWDNANPDPSIYKSGDADRVTLTDTGISVVHYDIFSGPASAPPNEPEGREKLCEVYKMAWDKAADRIWFGANHGFAMGHASYTGNNTCNGNQSCSGLMEHVHPAINGWKDETRTGTPVLLTADYRGVAIDPTTHNVFFGGVIRSTIFTFGQNSRNLTDPARGYWDGQSDTEGKDAYQWDLWPDRVKHVTNQIFPTPSERVDDLVYGAATTGDGTFWVSSSGKNQGVVHVTNTGVILGYVTTELVSPNASVVAADPLDNSIWVGTRWGGGISRIQSGQVIRYGLDTFGRGLANLAVTDIQVMGSGASRQILVTFDDYTNAAPGGVGIYSAQ